MHRNFEPRRRDPLKGRGRREVLALALLVLAALACQVAYDLVSIPDPEGAATDAFIPAPTAMPRPTRTPRPSLEGTPTPKPAQPTLAAAFDDLAQFRAAMRPRFAGDVDQFPNATRYAIEVGVTFNADGSATLTGRERIRYTNRQDFPLDAVYLMLWPNDDAQYLSEMALWRVTVDGADAPPDFEHDGLAARVDLPQPLDPGAAVEVSAEFEVIAYPGIDTTGPARFGLTHDVLLAPTFYPLVPRLTEGGEWQTMPAPFGGDTTNSDTALYWWRVTAPADLTIVGTGTVVETRSSSLTQTLTLITGPVRDLALVVGPLELTQREVDGITVNAYLLDEHAEFTDRMLDYTVGQIETLQAAVGSYPFAELDVVDAPGAFGGIEYPGTIFIGVVDDRDFFKYATVHEVGHQWFYSLIGDDQLLEPWLDEAAATYTEVLYEEEVHGQRAAQDLLSYFWDDVESSDAPGLPIGLPVGDYPSGSDYGTIVYSKGALFFDALRREMGDRIFFRFLKDYYAAYRYGFARSQDFQATAEQTCACDLDALFDLWVYKGGEVTRP